MLVVTGFIKFLILHFSIASRNETTRITQPEVVFPMRSDASHSGLPNGNNIDRKGTVAIGQSVHYTDYPPKEYGHSSGSRQIIYISIFYYNIIIYTLTSS